MKIYWLWVLLPFLCSSAVHGQERLLFTHSCNYTGEISPEEDLYGFASDNEAEDAMRRIMKYTGLPANFNIKAANVPNAAAVLHQEKRYILYNQYFMLRIKDQTQTDWAALSILAHEIGHHLSGHTLDNQGSRPDKELEADRFSGYVLYKMGAKLEEARVAMETLASDVGTSTHPPKSARLAAVTNGWLEAQQQNATVSPIGLKTTAESRDAPPRIQPRGAAIDPRTASSSFKKVWVEEDAEQGGVKGLRIHTQFNVSNLFGQNCRAVVWFYDALTGQALEDQNGQFATASGKVSAGADFVPNYVSADFTDFPIFIPHEELHLGEGEHRVKFQIGLYHRLPGGQMQQVGPVSAFQTFSYGAGAAQPSVEFQETWIETGAFQGGDSGLRIHLLLRMKDFGPEVFRAVTWFYFDSGLPLPDANSRYCTPDGRVAVETDFFFKPAGAGLQELVFFIPHDELHLSEGNHKLKFETGLFREGSTGYEPVGERMPPYRFIFSR
jgi:hypothetical protein